MTNWALFNSVFNTSTIESLKAEEKLIAKLIFENARDVVESMVDTDFLDEEEEDDVEFAEKFELTRKNLTAIVNAFNEVQNARKVFQKYVPVWTPSRKKTISSLRGIADCINTDRFNCNVSKITGSAVGIVGGAALGAAIIFPPAALVLAIAGGVASIAGGATVIGTSATEIALLSNKMNTAENVIKKDEKKFVPLAKWFTHSQNLINLLDKIVGFTVIEEIFEGLKKFRADVTDLISLRGGTMDSALRDLIKSFIKSAAPVGLTAACSGFVWQIPVIVTFVFVMILFRKNNRFLFDCVVLTQRIVLGLVKLLDLGSDLGMLICNIAAKAGVATAEIAAKASAKMIAQGALAGFGVALDVTNLVFASIDIHNGSVSEHAVHLKALADHLEKDLEVVEAVYNALF